jgi:HCOMODA/2-hydroxy-3-carboxy-muconic semialdehyde decarboxylase
MLRRRLFCGCAAALFAPMVCRAQTSAVSPSAGPADPALIDDIVAANRILFDQGVVDGFGHVSARHDKAPDRFLLARSMAPGLVTKADIMEFDLDSAPVDPQGRAVYLERFIHGEIYRLYPDVKAVVHSHSPSVIPFGVSHTSLKPLYHMSGFLGAGAPVFEIRDTAGNATDMLIRNRELGHALALSLGDHKVLLMRGHGSVVVAPTIRQVVFEAVYTEINARMESEALRLGDVTFLSEQEAEAAARTNAGQVNRPWELWRKKAMEGR